MLEGYLGWIFKVYTQNGEIVAIIREQIKILEEYHTNSDFEIRIGIRRIL